jgi:SecY interacting protein Syd
VSTADSLDRFIARYLGAGTPPPETFDPEWRSPCEQGAPFAADDGERRVAWRPVRRDDSVHDLFSGLERALELELHADIKTFYGRWWSAHLDARAPDGPVSLILLWNVEDAERLLENLVGHALAKRQLRAPFTVFFANTDPESDLFLSVDNATGQVLLEQPGRPPLRVVADSLASFLDSLEPAPPPAP